MPEPVLTQLPFTLHGGPDGQGPPRFDFSVNSNPFGPPHELLTLLNGLDLEPYPDPTEREAREAAATFHGAEPACIVLGSAAELIYRLAACYLDRSRSVLVATPTFGEYARASRLHGAEVAHVNVYTKGHEPDADALMSAIATSRPTLVFVCQPNNPTGHAWSAEALNRIAEACQQEDTLLVLDVAYLELSTAPAALPASAAWLIPLTKTFALAGLRAGYAVAPPDVAQTLRNAAPPWPVSAPAQAAVRWCRSSEGAAFVEATVPVLLELRHTLQTALRNRGFNIWESASSFFLLETPNHDLAADAKRAGLRLRDTASLGLPGYVRIATQTREANEALASWLSREGN